MFAGLLKWVLVLILILAGLAFLFAGVGASVPWVKFKGLEAHEVPEGLVILAAGVALAVFWKVSWRTRTTRLDESSPDHGGNKITRTVVDERSTDFSDID